MSINPLRDPLGEDFDKIMEMIKEGKNLWEVMGKEEVTIVMVPWAREHLGRVADEKGIPFPVYVGVILEAHCYRELYPDDQGN